MDGLLGVAGIIIDSYCGSFPHSLLSTSKLLVRPFTWFPKSQRSVTRRILTRKKRGFVWRSTTILRQTQQTHCWFYVIRLSKVPSMFHIYSYIYIRMYVLYVSMYMIICIWLYVYMIIYDYIYTCIHPCTTRQAQFWWSSKCQKSLAETTLFRFSGPKVEDGWNFSQIARAPAEMMGDRSAISSTWATWIPKKKYPYISYKKGGYHQKWTLLAWQICLVFRLWCVWARFLPWDFPVVSLSNNQVRGMFLIKSCSVYPLVI